MRLKMKLAALGAFALLAIAIVAAVVLSAAPAAATEDEAPVVTVDEEEIEGVCNLTVNVGGKIEGKNVPLTGAEVFVYVVNITVEENRTTIVIEKVAEGVTDANGTVTFSLEEGKYCIMAKYHGLKGFARLNLSEDESATINMHNWPAECERGKAWKKVLARGCQD